MDLGYYNLQADPFGAAPDPQFFFPSPDHSEALKALAYGVRARKGCMAITGGVGSGKTTVARAFMEGLDARTQTAIYVCNALASFDLMLQRIRPGASGATPRERLQAVHEWLVSEYAKGRNVILIVDDAQRMAATTLEKLRLLADLQTRGHRLLQIVLAGRPPLEDMLESHDLRRLRRRLAARTSIGPLSRNDSLAYVEHRLAEAAVDAYEVFSQSALWQLIKHANGNPRVLNILCSHALATGYAYQSRRITTQIAAEAITDLVGPVQRQAAWRETLRAQRTGREPSQLAFG